MMSYWVATTATVEGREVMVAPAHPAQSHGEQCAPDGPDEKSADHEADPDGSAREKPDEESDEQAGPRSAADAASHRSIHGHAARDPLHRAKPRSDDLQFVDGEVGGRQLVLRALPGPGREATAGWAVWVGTEGSIASWASA